MVHFTLFSVYRSTFLLMYSQSLITELLWDSEQWCLKYHHSNRNQSQSFNVHTLYWRLATADVLGQTYRFAKKPTLVAEPWWLCSFFWHPNVSKLEPSIPLFGSLTRLTSRGTFVFLQRHLTVSLPGCTQSGLSPSSTRWYWSQGGIKFFYKHIAARTGRGKVHSV